MLRAHVLALYDSLHHASVRLLSLVNESLCKRFKTSTNRMQSILKRSLKLCFRADISI